MNYSSNSLYMMKYIEWALDTLQSLGCSLQAVSPESILQTPWSSVYRFNTDRGYFYLKQVPTNLYLEVKIIDFLKKTFKASVPTVVACNADQHCFLMQDEGIQLREFFTQNTFNAPVLIQAIHSYIAIQRESHVHLPQLLAMGVTDWRLTKIPDWYQKLIDEKQLLIVDGLTSAEIAQLSRLTPKLVSLCEQLSEYAIPNTFGHSDFHDKNILINPKTKQITFVDLGEVEVSHPFFSLANMLGQVKDYYRLKEEAYQWIQQKILQPWLDLLPQKDLLKAMSLIQQCWPIHRALIVYRLLTSIDSEATSKLLGQGKLAKLLKIWLA